MGGGDPTAANLIGFNAIVLQLISQFDVKSKNINSRSGYAIAGVPDVPRGKTYIPHQNTVVR